MKKKINLKEEVENTTPQKTPREPVSEEDLLELCPPAIKARFKKAKTAAARADLLYEIEKAELKAARDTFKQLEKFVSKLEAWFIEQFEDDDQKGVTGKTARVEVKSKDCATVEDWDKFYTHIKKKGEFDLLNRAVNQKAVQERWDQKKQVPGVGKFVKRVLSITKVKK